MKMPSRTCGWRVICTSAAGVLRGAVLCAALLGMTAALLPAAAQNDNFGLKNLQGKVLNDHNTPINGAIVYLKDSRNNDIKSFISTSDGAYRFADLAADTDYTVWAAYHGRKSPSKEVSSFDTRKQVYIDLHIK